MNLSKIDVSLSHGKVLAGKSLILLCVAATLFLLLSIGGIVSLIVSDDFETKNIWGYVSLIVLSTLAFFVFIYILIKNAKCKRKLLIRQDDFIEINAYSKKIDEYKAGRCFTKVCKIQVQFKFNDKILSKDSSFKTWGLKRGYSEFFNQYADRWVQILYSPKYDQVLILKDEKKAKEK